MDDKNGKDRGLDALVIDEATYKNLLRMLNSSKEDQLVALQCIKSMNKQRNHVAIAFLRKNTSCPSAMWDTNCKSHLKYQSSIGLPEGSPITFAKIYTSIEKETQYQIENKKFFTFRYIEYLKDNLVKMDFVESVEINVKIKGYE